MGRSEARESALGALFMTGFGAVWAIQVEAVSTSTIQTVIIFACVAAVALILLRSSLALLKASSQLPENDTREHHPDEARKHKLFNLNFAVEGIAIGLTCLICFETGNTQYLPPVIAIIVGLHFLPLAALFNVRLYYVTGAMMMLIPALMMIAIPSTSELGGTKAWLAITMAWSALVLWLTALGVLLMTRSALSGREWSI